MAGFIVSILGVSPLLQHRWTENSEAPTATRATHVQRLDPRAEAEQAAYRMEDGALYLPGTAIARMLREAGGAHKARGSRKSLKFIVPSAVLVVEDQIPLLDEAGRALRDFEVDSRPVVIPATKGRIMRHRPRLNSWAATFSIEIDPEIMDADMAHQLLNEGGLRCGVGDFRPEKGGPFGRFRVTKWQEIEVATPVKRRKAA